MNVTIPMTPAKRLEAMESSAFPYFLAIGLAMAAAIIIPIPMAPVEADWAVALP